MDQPKFLTVAQVAKALNVSEITIRRETAKNTIPHAKIAGSVRIPAVWVDQMVTRAMEAFEDAR